MGYVSRLAVSRLAVLILLSLIAAWPMAMADQAPLVTLAKPVTGVASIRHGTKAPENVPCTMTAWNDDSLTIQPKTGDARTLYWINLTGNSAFDLRSKVIDKKDAQAWLKLGTLVWGLNDTRDAKGALATAARLDPTLKDDVEAVLASGAGILLDLSGPELIHDAPADSDDDTPPPADPKVPQQKYQKISPAQAKTALAANRANAKQVSEEMHVDLKELETPHFLIFTDWGPRSNQFLEDNMEAAYRVVTAQFDIPDEENVFVGKLGVFMFANNADFLKFAATYDHLTRKDIAGYYAHRGSLLAHMAMYKPDSDTGLVGKQQEQEWAYVLTHEFTHAFVARYRSNRNIPTWLNEGLAEVVASGQFPTNTRLKAPIGPADHEFMQQLFEDDAPMQSGPAYPIMRTVTTVLIRQDRTKFLKMFDEIKAGATGERALKDNFNCTFDDLEAAWRRAYGVKSR